MVKYTIAALSLLSTANVGTFASSPSWQSAFIIQPTNILQRNKHYDFHNNLSRRYSAIPYDDAFAEMDSNNNDVVGTGLIPGNLPGLIPSTATNLLDVDNFDEVDAEVESLLAKKEQRRVARLSRSKKPNYQITLPINGGILVQPPPPSTSKKLNTNNEDKKEELASLVAKGQEIAVTNSIGMSLRQVYSGRKLSELALDVDTLRFQSFVDELQGRRVDGEEATEGAAQQTDASSVKEGGGIGSIQVLQTNVLEMLTETFDGVVVSSVARGGLAWESGVRAGDVLTATSATLGDKLWPKSTLDGVRSAISSRKVIVPTMDFEFRRLVQLEDDTMNPLHEEVVQSFELALSRPIGINVEGETLYLLSNV